MVVKSDVNLPRRWGASGPVPGATPEPGLHAPELGLDPEQEDADEFADGDAAAPHAGPFGRGVTTWGGGIFTAVILIILFFFFAIIVSPFSGGTVW